MIIPGILVMFDVTPQKRSFLMMTVILCAIITPAHFASMVLSHLRVHEANEKELED